MIPEHSGFKNLRTRMSNSLDTCGLKPYPETHVNVDNVCELTSKRLRTDFYMFANSHQRRLRNDRHYYNLSKLSQDCNRISTHNCYYKQDVNNNYCTSVISPDKALLSLEG